MEETEKQVKAPIDKSQIQPEFDDLETKLKGIIDDKQFHDDKLPETPQEFSPSFKLVSKRRK
jgi:hypothetical protein